ncbi:MAG: primosomal protein N' [Prevotellaceae bacterium]|nr:primosomal protein N' [Prevotellaceae bacterium]
MFVKVLLPLYLQEALLYSLPATTTAPAAGTRVVVPLRGKLYSGIVVETLEKVEVDYTVREVAGAPEEKPTVTALQLKLWRWIARYYMCTEGEVMKAALPARLKSENITENTRENARSLSVSFVALHPDIDSDEKLAATLDSMKRGTKGERLLLTYLELAEPLSLSAPPEIPEAELLKQSGVSTQVLKSCEKKGLFALVRKRAERTRESSAERLPERLPELSPHQQKAFEAIKAADKPVLLYGVTSSGKTEIYIRLIAETLRTNRQALYLLPEIALTTQITERLRAVFGDRIAVYHSNFSDAERAETYSDLLAANDKADKAQLILGVRSSLLLPFSNLGLIIVDEEHENTYKQFDPAPRYNARDTAVVAARMHGAKIVLGSATPSIESYHNALTGKYALVRLTERYGSAVLPEIRTLDMRRARRKKKITASFSETLLNAITETTGKGEQVILFQNRRGYSPYVQCDDCGFTLKCECCDVSLTYHKFNSSLSCHYCGYSAAQPSECPQCRSTNIKAKGLGTEKIEDDLSFLLPEARVERLDLDSVSSRSAYERILNGFESGATNILVGTQMICKGLDFGNVSLVGVMNADSLLNFPDFRACERSFQLMSQVAGRAGRANKPGMVLIQTSMPENPVIRQVVNHDYETFFETQIVERLTFNYPPFCRLILVSLKHSNRELLQEAGAALKIALTKVFGANVAGPEPPPVGRVQNKYILCFRIKLKKDGAADSYKDFLRDAFARLRKEKKYSGLIVIADVDPA